jgi:hypothetical protein
MGGTMGFFGMLFWFAALWFAFRAFRSWNSCGTRGVWRDRLTEGGDRPHDQQPYIDALESRVAELEERLDFTERLVAERREAVS